jgi:hypothetical protein
MTVQEAQERGLAEIELAAQVGSARANRGGRHRVISQETYEEWVRVAAFYIYLKRVDQEFNHGNANTDWERGCIQINHQVWREGIVVEA